MFAVSFPLALSTVWLFTPSDIPPPVIGFIVMVTILVVMVIVIIKWYQYWMKKGLEEYKKQHPTQENG